jgi:hypothetical protein
MDELEAAMISSAVRFKNASGDENAAMEQEIGRRIF